MVTSFLVQEFDELPPQGLKNTKNTTGSACQEYKVTLEPFHVAIRRARSSSSPFTVTTITTVTTSVITSLRNLFLPLGYPDTVRDGYWEYQVYDSLQGLCSYLRGVVSSAHVLKAAGVGNQEATAWSAALTWALKDGMGMMGGLVFAAWASPLFDAHVKEFRFFADIINNVGLTLDMLAPVLSSPEQFLWVAAASTLCKTMCGMSAGATKGSTTAHFAIKGNLADLHAKEGTQETLVSLMGMTLGIALAKYFQSLETKVSEGTMENNTAWAMQWSVFVSFTCLHVWANYRAVHILRLRTLNRQRATHVLQNVAGIQNKDDKEKVLATIQGPDQVDESLAASTWNMLLPERWSSMVLGARLIDVLDAGTSHSRELLQIFQQEQYVLTVTPRKLVIVCLLTRADNQTELKAFLHALILQHKLQQHKQQQHDTDSSQLIAWSYGIVCDLFSGNQNVWTQLEKQGWDLHERLYLGFSRRRSNVVALKED